MQENAFLRRNTGDAVSGEREISYGSGRVMTIEEQQVLDWYRSRGARRRWSADHHDPVEIEQMRAAKRQIVLITEALSVDRMCPVRRQNQTWLNSAIEVRRNYRRLGLAATLDIARKSFRQMQTLRREKGYTPLPGARHGFPYDRKTGYIPANWVEKAAAEIDLKFVRCRMKRDDYLRAFEFMFENAEGMWSMVLLNRGRAAVFSDKFADVCFVFAAQEDMLTFGLAFREYVIKMASDAAAPDRSVRLSA